MTINFCGPWFLGLGCSDTIAPPPPADGSFAGDRDCMATIASMAHETKSATEEVASISEAATETEEMVFVFTKISVSLSGIIRTYGFDEFCT